MKFYNIIFILFCINLSACQFIDSEKMIDNEQIENTSMSAILDKKISSMVDDLTSFKKYDYKNKATLITTIVWSDSLTFKNVNHPMQYLGHQLSESIKTELVHREAKVLEHKSAAHLAVSTEASYFLSRDIELLAKESAAEYIIAGTFIESKDGAMVNIEVIDFKSHEILGTAGEFFPNTLFWPVNDVYMRDGKFIRESK